MGRCYTRLNYCPVTGGTDLGWGQELAVETHHASAVRAGSVRA